MENYWPFCCVESSLRILNGRTYGDSLGFYTCFHDNGGVCSVDYSLALEHVFDKIRFFNVQPPNVFSDHCPIWMGLTFQYSMGEESVPISQLDGKFIWSGLTTSQYTQSINSQRSIKILSDYTALLDVHKFSCSDEAVQSLLIRC